MTQKARRRDSNARGRHTQQHDNGRPAHLATPRANRYATSGSERQKEGQKEGDTKTESAPCSNLTTNPMHPSYLPRDQQQQAHAHHTGRPTQRHYHETSKEAYGTITGWQRKTRPE